MSSPAPARLVSHLLRRVAALGVAAVVPLAGLAALPLAPAAAQGTGTLLLEDSFQNSTVVGTSYISGGRNTRACLTASTNTAQSPIPGCGGAADPDGSGALRLTGAVNNQAGFLVYDKPLPTKAGLDITFNTYQWGGTQADGISFFLADGSQALTAAGAFGGSLGYNNQIINGGPDGVRGGLLGIGFDVYGNYTVETHNPSCNGVDNARRGSAPANHKNTVAVRGPGTGQNGYCLLSPAVSVPELGTRSGAVRPAPVAVRVVVDPPGNASPKVRVFVGDVSATATADVVVDQPAVLATTPTFKFGWGASTGGQNDDHEINFLRVESVDVIRPDLRITGTASPTSANTGTASTLTLNPRVRATGGPVPAGEPVTITAPAPSGLSFGTPTSAGGAWDCSATTPSQLSCVRTSATRIDPDTDLPALSVPLTSPGTSGDLTVTATIDSATNDTAPETVADDQVSATVRFIPVATPVSEAAVDASATPAPVEAEVPVNGTAPFTTQVTTPADAAVGTIAPGPGSSVVVTPAAGASGLISGQVTVTDSRSTSAPVVVQMPVRPVVTDRVLETSSGSAQTLAAQAPVGTGPFTWSIVSPPAFGTASVGSTGALSFDPGTGTSGTTSFTYRVVGRDGVASTARTVSVTVRPTSPDDLVHADQVATGDVVVTRALPTPSGTGPFTYELQDTDLGGAAASLAGNVLTVQTDDSSGEFVATYRAVDRDGVPGEWREVTVVVAPYAPAVAGSTTTGGTASVARPGVVGTGPFTWALTPGAPAGASVGATSGLITYAAGTSSADAVFSYVVTDADGVPSPAAAVTVDVRPTADPVSGTATASAAPAPVVLTPAVHGTDVEIVTVSSLPADRGTTAVDGPGLVVTPAAGVSGRLSGTYVVRDADGDLSAPAAWTVEVAPVARAGALETTSGSTASLTLPTPVGTGPFSWVLDTVVDPAQATVTLVDGVLVVTPTSTSSGSLPLSYHVVGVDDVASVAAAVDVTVRPAGPSVPPTTTPGTATRGGTGTPLTSPQPQPQGDGPFAFELVDVPAPTRGTGTIDPTTGVVTFTPTPGTSGRTTFTYRVTDVHGLVSDPVTVTFEVAPAADPVPTTATVSGRRTAVQLPATGTGLTYSLLTVPTAAQGTVTLDPVTGELVFTPAVGFTGDVVLRYVVTDADGLVSEPASVAFSVSAPVVPPTSAAASALPRTGSEVLLVSVVGAGMLLLGGAALVASRRRPVRARARHRA